MAAPIEGLTVTTNTNADGSWTVYLVRNEDGMCQSVAYSSVYPGQTAEQVAASWYSFLGIQAATDEVQPVE